MKGVSSLIASVMLVLITIVASMFISGWLTSTTTTQTSAIKNATYNQLQCQFADIYVKNATYNCNADCSGGIQHTASVTVVNSGKRAVSIDRIYLRNTTGSVTTLNLLPITLKVSDITEISNVSTGDCSGINNSIEFVSITTTNCPNTAYDNYEGNQVVYLNC